MPNTISVGLSTVASPAFCVNVTVFADHPSSAPVVSVPREQLYYWSRQWQEDEALALEDLAEGRSREFSNGTEAVRWLLSAED